MIQRPVAFMLVENEAPDSFGVSHHREDGTPGSFREFDFMFLPCAATFYLTNTDKPKCGFSMCGLYKVDSQYISAIRVLFLKIFSNRPSLFAPSGFIAFLNYKITHFNSFKSRIRIIKIVINLILALPLKPRGPGNAAGAQKPRSSKKSVQRMRTIFFDISS